MIIKSVVSEIYHLVVRLMVLIPIQPVRRIVCKVIMKSFSMTTSIRRNVDLRSPYRISIGRYCNINKKCVLDGRGPLTIGNYVDIAQEVNIWTSQHDYNDDYHKLDNAGVTIDDYAWVAARATIIPGVNIGRGAVVGTCSLVTKDVAPMDVVGGVPAKHISTRTSQLKYRLFHRVLFQ